MNRNGLLESWAAVGIFCLAGAGLLVPGSARAQDVGDLSLDNCSSYICIEANTGLVVSEYRADVPRAPASMVKMMLMLTVAEGTQQGKWTLDDEITVSEHTEAIGGSQVFLKEGEQFTLDQLIHCVAVGSANDAAMAIAEGLWGGEAKYLEYANERAQELGMEDTIFRSVHGLPPDAGEKYDRTTARDIAILAQWCVRNPLVMKWVGQESYQLRTTDRPRGNTNRLVGTMEGCDGLKTGFTNAAGYCLTATAERDGMRLIGVVMGCSRLSYRFSGAEKVLEYGFSQVRRFPLLAQGEQIQEGIPVRNCEVRLAHARVQRDLEVIIRAQEIDQIELVADLPKSLRAPVQAGTQVGELVAMVNGEPRGTVPLEVSRDLPSAGWRWKLEQAALGVRPVSN